MQIPKNVKLRNQSIFFLLSPLENLLELVRWHVSFILYVVISDTAFGILVIKECY